MCCLPMTSPGITAYSRANSNSALFISAADPYIGPVPVWNYEHKRARNKRIGPGGGTRRLHQISCRLRDQGAETGSTNV